MNCDDKVREFWTKAERLGSDSNEAALYFALLEIFRRNDYPTTYSIGNDVICRMVYLEIKTMRRIRSELVEKGFIKYFEGNAKRLPTYMIDVPESDGLDIPVIEVRPKGKPRGKPKRKKVETERIPKETVEGDLFGKLKEVKKKKVKKEYVPPTMDEVREAFRTAGFDVGEADGFYYYYDSQDWYKANGKIRISKLDSAVNSWMNNKNKKKGGKDGGFKSDDDYDKERNDAVREWVLDGIEDK